MDNFGDRMKGYENAYRTKMPKRMPVIIRIDGKAFHTYTRGMEKPFDEVLSTAMLDTAKYLCQNVMGCKLAYTQSDEISLLLTNYDKLTTEAWFDNNIQKIVSVAASLATAKFNEIMKRKYPNKQLALFDARVWVLPQDEVCNYFLWRQQDATKNSISMVAQANFRHKELQGLNGKQMQDKLMLEREINWNDIPTKNKRGACVIKNPYYVDDDVKLVKRSEWKIDVEIPIFSQDRDYINQFVYLNEDK